MNKASLMMVPVVLVGALVQSNVAMAQGTIVGKVGTLGAGIEYVHPFSSKLALGLGLNGLSYDEAIEESDIDYDATLDMQTFALIGDFHPFANGFRLSAGVMHNGNEFSLEGTPTGSETVNINGKDYEASDIGSLESLIGFKSTAPYLGIGWGKTPNSGKGWGFDADLGVLFQGTPIVSLTANCSQALKDAGGCDELQDNVAEEEKDLAVDSEEFEIFPVISIGASYTF
jgi:hypothetical protein